MDGQTAPTHRTAAELEGFLSELGRAPLDEGVLELIVRRPARLEREVAEGAELDLDLGLVGDSWQQRGSRHTDDGRAERDRQITVMGSRIASFIAGAPERVPLAGDQLYVDLDLSEDNLPAGTLLAFGLDPQRPAAVVVVTAPPHTGCAQFVERFGAEAMRFVNGREGRRLRLRGLNARVVQAGPVRRGDSVTVIRPAAGG